MARLVRDVNDVWGVQRPPIIDFLEDHPKFAPRFQTLFDAHAAGRVRFAITTMTMAEVLTGPVSLGDEALVRRYRGILESWQVISLNADIAEGAARVRASHRLKMADAVQVASALAVNADALVTHDRDFTSVQSCAGDLVMVELERATEFERANRELGKPVDGSRSLPCVS